jgi:hypothetical protein
MRPPRFWTIHPVFSPAGKDGLFNRVPEELGAQFARPPFHVAPDRVGVIVMLADQRVGLAFDPFRSLADRLKQQIHRDTRLYRCNTCFYRNRTSTL